MTDAPSIIERLRTIDARVQGLNKARQLAELLHEAANEIERLTAERDAVAKRLENALNIGAELRARVAELEARLEGFECCRATIERCAQAIEPNLDIKTESERIKGECAALKWAAATIRDLAAKPKD